MYSREYQCVCKSFSAAIFLVLPVIIFMLSPSVTEAQTMSSDEVLRSSSEDANTLLQEYFRPFGNGLGADLNSGWFSSAEPLKKFEFGFKVSVSASLVPSKDRLFDVTQLDLNTIHLLRGPSKTPTAFGEDGETSTLGATNYNSATQQEEELFSFQMPKGSGYHFVPVPMAQISFGLPGHTQITVRYTPTIKIDSNYRMNMLGVGGMIGLTPLLFNNAFPLDLSLQAGVMSLNATSPFKIEPLDDIGIENPYPDSHWAEQGIEFSSRTFVVNILAGKRFSVLSLFTGFGYQYASTDIQTTGSLPVAVTDSDKTNPSVPPVQEIESIEEPIIFTLEGVNNLHILGGFQIRLAFVSLSAAYTFAEYSTVKAGVGFVF